MNALSLRSPTMSLYFLNTGSTNDTLTGCCKPTCSSRFWICSHHKSKPVDPRSRWAEMLRTLRLIAIRNFWKPCVRKLRLNSLMGTISLLVMIKMERWRKSSYIMLERLMLLIVFALRRGVFLFRKLERWLERIFELLAILLIERDWSQNPYFYSTRI